MTKPITTAVYIDNWFFGVSSSNEYSAPESEFWCLFGDVQAHPRLGDMAGVRTSRIEDIDAKNQLIQTYNTLYALGSPNIKFVEACEKDGHTPQSFLDTAEKANKS
jgi:hypothetical protein